MFRLVIVVALISASPGVAAATLLTSVESFRGATVISDWHEIGARQGEDGPVVFGPLTIQSHFNDPWFQYEIVSSGQGDEAGYKELGASGESVLSANITRTHFEFTFPTTVERAGLFFRDEGRFVITAFDEAGNWLEEAIVDLSWPNNVAFRGFADVPGLRSLSVWETRDGAFSSDFDDVQWIAAPEPSTATLASGAAMLLLTVLFRRRKAWLWHGQETVP